MSVTVKTVLSYFWVPGCSTFGPGILCDICRAVFRPPASLVRTLRRGRGSRPEVSGSSPPSRSAQRLSRPVFPEKIVQ